MAIKKRLGEMLVEAGIIDETQLHAALGHQRQWGGRLGAVLVELKLASEEAIVDALALKFGFDVGRLEELEPYAFEQAKALLPRDYAVRNRIFPMAADTGVLVVAMSDPTNLALTDELAFKTGRRIKVCIAGENAISAAVRAHYGEEAAAQREAIALDVDDETTVEPLYDPIGATSNEELSRFFQQPPPAPPTPAARVAAIPVPPPAPATPTTRPAVPAPVPAARAPAPPAAARPLPAPARPAATAPVPAPRPPAPAPAPGRTPPPVAAVPAPARSRAELQLEDQKTESIPLVPIQPLEETEELQPIPLEPEPLPGGEPYVPSAEEEWVEGPARQRELTAEESLILEALDRMAGGDDATPTVVRPAQLLASLVRLMMRKQLITEQELLDEILRG